MNVSKALKIKKNSYTAFLKYNLIITKINFCFGKCVTNFNRFVLLRIVSFENLLLSVILKHT